MNSQSIRKRSFSIDRRTQKEEIDARVFRWFRTHLKFQLWVITCRPHKFVSATYNFHLLTPNQDRSMRTPIGYVSLE